MSQLVDAIAGAPRPGQSFVWYQQNADGTLLPVDLTGATLSGELRDVRQNALRTIAGSLIPDPDQTNNRGWVHWDYDLADVVEGTYNVIFSAAYGTGPSPAKTYAARWNVVPGSP